MEKTSAYGEVSLFSLLCTSESDDICFFSPSLLYSHAHTTTWFWAIRFLSSPWLEYSPVRHGSGSRLLHHSPQNFSRRETWFVWSCLLLDDDARFLIIFIRGDMEKESLWQMVVVLHLFWLLKRIPFFSLLQCQFLFFLSSKDQCLVHVRSRLQQQEQLLSPQQHQMLSKWNDDDGSPKEEKPSPYVGAMMSQDKSVRRMCKSFSISLF